MHPPCNPCEDNPHAHASVCLPLCTCDCVYVYVPVCVPVCAMCSFAVSATVGENCISPCSATGAAMVKCIKQDMGSQKSAGTGDKSNSNSMRASGTQKIILPVQKMRGRLLKNKVKIMEMPEPSKKKKNTSKGKKKVNTKGRGKGTKIGSKKKKVNTKGQGKAKSKVPKSKVPESKVVESKSEVPRSKVHNKKDIIYARVSSSKQADKAGFKRQQERCAAKAGKADTVKEVVSGSLPAAQRTQFVDILKNNNGRRVYIENSRALARSTVAGEQLYEMSKENNVQIVSIDMPELFGHQPSAGTAFLRRVMLAAQEFERDIIVERLQHGLKKAKAHSKRRTQSGSIKVQGSRSTLEQVKPNRATINSIRALANKGWSQRMIRDVMRNMLNRPRLGTSTAMRIMSEVQCKS